MFDKITKHLIEGVVIINKKGTIQTVNKAIIDLFGYDEEDLIGNNVKILMPHEYRKNHDQYIKNYNDTGVAQILDIGRPVQGQRKDGSIFSSTLRLMKLK